MAKLWVLTYYLPLINKCTLSEHPWNTILRIRNYLTVPVLMNVFSLEK